MSKDVKGGKERMQEVVVKQTIYRDECPYCKKIIESRFPKQLEYNLEIHKRNCKVRPLQSENEKR